MHIHTYKGLRRTSHDQPLTSVLLGSKLQALTGEPLLEVRWKFPVHPRSRERGPEDGRMGRELPSRNILCSAHHLGRCLTVRLWTNNIMFCLLAWRSWLVPNRPFLRPQAISKRPTDLPTYRHAGGRRKTCAIQFLIRDAMPTCPFMSCPFSPACTG